MVSKKCFSKVLKEFGSGPFSVISIFPSTVKSCWFSLFSFNFSYKFLIPFLICFLAEKLYSLFRGYLIEHLGRKSLNTASFSSQRHDGPKNRHVVLSSLLTVTLNLKNFTEAYMFCSNVAL